MKKDISWMIAWRNLSKLKLNNVKQLAASYPALTSIINNILKMSWVGFGYHVMFETLE
jgi:hypothetical protein